MCNNPILKTQSEFLALIKEVIGKRSPNDRSLIVSINQALSSVASRSCICIELPCPIACGVCEYDLPCCDIDMVIPEVKDRHCTGGQCWHRLPWWDVRCGKLVTDGRISGHLRLTIFARNPDFGLDGLSLAKTMLLGDDSLWLEGRIDGLPPTGWVKVCNEWLQYLCLEHSETPKPDMIAINAAPYDPADGVTAEWGVDPAKGFASGEAPCGVHTVLRGLRRRCNNQGMDSYAPGTTVELGLALQDAASMEYLQDRILANAYRSLAAGCASIEDRQFYLQLMADSDARADKAMQRRSTGRPVIKQRDQFALRNSCCGNYAGCGV